MNRFQLKLDTESINKESEEHSNNFYLKVKGLAEHCVNFIQGTHNKSNCNDNKFNRDIHDQDSSSLGNIDDKKYRTKVITQLFQFKEKDSVINVTTKF